MELCHGSKKSGHFKQEGISAVLDTSKKSVLAYDRGVCQGTEGLEVEGLMREMQTEWILF